ncbi:hypothetical protein JCM17845_08460 [Iodidimonas gelatinilytica]|uniref:DUF5935 domain-containing protein n=1 Tax=Iodidimonas gelatinilytica TaxID=1236966 RepID=A0A5A7MW21_9PROT|nr:DUF5935 domain-containing protein [Iodidimonas gelatinilytica]GER00223.1 hypothetical protein JCM17845_08460 [Iodidimonas gelatinilytica]
MTLSSLFLLVCILILVPLIFISPVVGLYSYHWISLLNPHRLVYGPAYFFPFAMVLAGLTIGSWLISAEQKKITFTAPVIILLIFALWVTFTSFFAQVPESVWTYWGRAEKTFLMTFITVILVTSRELFTLWFGFSFSPSEYWAFAAAFPPLFR